MWCNSVGFVCWLAPLLILRSVGNCRCFVCQSSFAVSFFRVTANVAAAWRSYGAQTKFASGVILPSCLLCEVDRREALCNKQRSCRHIVAKESRRAISPQRLAALRSWGFRSTKFQFSTNVRKKHKC